MIYGSVIKNVVDNLGDGFEITQNSITRISPSSTIVTSSELKIKALPSLKIYFGQITTFQATNHFLKLPIKFTNLDSCGLAYSHNSSNSQSGGGIIRFRYVTPSDSSWWDNNYTKIILQNNYSSLCVFFVAIGY